MNHILNQARQIRLRDEANERGQKAIESFILHLRGEKFQGFDFANGERKDWIATADVIARLMELRKELQVEE